MEKVFVFKNEYISIFSLSNEVYIESFKKGFPMGALHEVFSENPRLEIVSLNLIRDAVNNAPKPPTRFGRLKPKIHIDIAPDQLKATIVFNMNRSELDQENRKKLMSEVSYSLREAGIEYGIRRDLFKQALEPGKPYIVAEGTPPVNGTDSVINMYQLEEPSPNALEDGSVNYYELKLINRVNAGDWLGEKIYPTQGIPGISILNNPVPPVPGRNLPLLYDRNTVVEVPETGKNTLYARINGAVSYAGERITVSNHLEIDGNVDFHTGNIDFDGFLTIKGTVEDGFSVTATRDIEINGDLGLGNIKEIVSREGSVYIKGGLTSKGNSRVSASKNVYTRFIDNACVKCGGSLHIGFYCINSNVWATEVLLDSPNGLIIGGEVKAGIRVISPIIGSEIEKRTIIEVEGFNRRDMAAELERLNAKTAELKLEQNKIKQKAALINNLPGSDDRELNSIISDLFALKDELHETEEKIKDISHYLKTRGEGEIAITKRIYPNCQLVIKSQSFEVRNKLMSATFYLQDSELKQL